MRLSEGCHLPGTWDCNPFQGYPSLSVAESVLEDGDTSLELSEKYNSDEVNFSTEIIFSVAQKKCGCKYTGFVRVQVLTPPQHYPIITSFNEKLLSYIFMKQIHGI